MRLVRVGGVRDGMELARDIPNANPTAAPLLRQGVILTERVGRRLAGLGIRAVWVEDGLGEGIEPALPLPDSVRLSAEEASARCLVGAQSAVHANGSIDDSDIDRIGAAVAGIARSLIECPDAACALDDLAAADAYTHTHSVRVTTLGLMLAIRIMRADGWTDWQGRQRFDGIPDRLIALGTGLLIHDIGKISIPPEILNKPGKLTSEEWALIKTHPEAGASMLPPTQISPLAISVVRDHHERWDGQGYPNGKRETEAHAFARIAAVADVYDALTSDRPYKRAAAPHIGVRCVLDGAGTQFDPSVVGHFKRVVMPYPVGQTLTLPDGGEAVVAAIDVTRPEWPTIRYAGSTGTLEQRRVNIVDGEVVGGYEPVRSVSAAAIRAAA
jgi:HD-GYP domain-containing protein (c-di-GMP phosphodiesterase class II)